MDLDERLYRHLIKKIRALEEQLGQHLESPEYQQDVWTPTFGGFSAGTPAGKYRYVLHGKLVVCFIEMTAGTSNATNFTLTGPFTAATDAGMSWRAVIPYLYDNSARLSAPGYAYIGSGSGTITCYPTIAGGTWTGSGSKYARFAIQYETA